MNALLLAGLLVQTPQVSILEAPYKEPGVIHIEAIVKTGSLTAEELGAANVVAKTLLDGSTSYNKYKLLEYGTLAGDQIRCSVGKDVFRISLSFPNNQPILAASITSDLLRNARLDEEVVKKAIEELPYRKLSPWQESLAPELPDYTGIRPVDARDLYKKVFRPENVILAISGDGLEEVRRELETSLASWKMTLYRDSRYRRRSVPKIQSARRSEVTTYEILGPEVQSSAELPRNLLAAFALGSGKWASVFRVVREEHGWSYRQEAILSPSDKGFRLRVIAAGIRAEKEDEIPEQMKAALLKDVESWTEEERSRALGMMSVVFDRGVDFSPLYFTPGRPVHQGVSDRVFLYGYGAAKFGKPLVIEDLKKEMSAVPLDELKKTAAETLNSSFLRVIKGGS